MKQELDDLDTKKLNLVEEIEKTKAVLWEQMN